MHAVKDRAARPRGSGMPLPKEHGSWAILLVPLVLGLGVAEGPAAAKGLFALMALSGFLARVPLLGLLSELPPPGARRWLGIHSGTAAAAAAPLFLYYGRWGLAGFAAPVLFLLAWTVRLTLARKQMSLANELAGILGLSLTAPAGYYAAAGRLDLAAWALGGLAALFLSGPVFHVKAAVAGHRQALNPAGPASFRSAAAATVAFHLTTLAAAAAGALAGAWPWPAVVPYALALAKTAWLVRLGPRKADFQRLGWSEVVYSLLFAGIVLAAWR